MPRLLVALAACALIAAACGDGGGDDTPRPTPVATVQLATGEQAEAALAAALAVVGGVVESPCEPDATKPPCVVGPQSSQPTVDGGIAVFQVGRVDSTILAMGRTAAGEWAAWFATPNFTYRRIALPGSMVVCSDGTPVRAEPDAGAAEVQTHDDGDELQVDGFVLTEPAENIVVALDEGGEGFYRVTSPAEGWVDSRAVSASNCDLLRRQQAQ
ncbi:MAG TPA: SH3 domain-containing protein [Dehalococcoidia bacterium]|nr:SH3 domain-containing protein [Dehalococcoidia bacterium]